MVKGFPLDKAELLSTLLECILYGFSLLMFGATVYQLWSRRYTGKVNWRMISVACLLLLCSTVHLVIDIVRIMEGLILYRDKQPGGPAAYFANVSQWTFVSKNYIYAAQTLIGDFVILYRCYIVWQSKLVMILPVMLWAAAAVTGFACAYTASQLGENSTVFCDLLVVWIKAFYATAFATNVLTTILLIYRIWDLDQRITKLRGHTDSRMKDILRTIVDAGAIYSITLLVLMICYSAQSNSQYVVLDMIVPTISITFYMVILRVGLLSNRTSQLRTDLPLVSTTVSCYPESGNRTQTRTTMPDSKMTEGRPSPGPMSPVIIDDDGSGQYRSETSLGNCGHAV